LKPIISDKTVAKWIIRAT